MPARFSFYYGPGDKTMETSLGAETGDQQRRKRQADSIDRLSETELWKI